MPKTFARRWLMVPSLLTLVGAVVLVGVLMRGQQATAGAAQTMTVALIAPQQAHPGEQIDVQLVATDARNLAGFQATVQSADARLGLLGATLADDLTRGGRDLLPLGPLVDERRVTLGAATCPVASCGTLQRNAAARVDQGVDGRVVLGTIELVATQPGQYTLALENLRLVDPEGNQLPSTTRATVVQVTVK